VCCRFFILFFSLCCLFFAADVVVVVDWPNALRINYQRSNGDTLSGRGPLITQPPGTENCELRSGNWELRTEHWQVSAACVTAQKLKIYCHALWPEKSVQKPWQQQKQQKDNRKTMRNFFKLTFKVRCELCK